MSKFTPGPWLVSRTTVYALNEQGYNCFSTQVQPGNTAPMEHTSDGELAANARLISAAPELLAALIYLRDCIETGKEPGMGIVHASIRKAEGKS